MTSDLIVRDQPAASPARVTELAAPPVDIHESADEFVLYADLPGASEGALSIELDAEQLVIRAAAPAEPDAQAIDREYRSLPYRRAFQLPRSVDRERVTAELDHGVLRITLPKLEAVKPRRVAVHSA